MAYNSAIPNASDLISSSQQQIKDNFSAIDSSTFGFAVDHVTLTDGTNGGKHKQVTIVSPTTPAAPSGSVAIAYSKTASGISELHYRNATAETQITKSTLTTASGEGFVPGGLQIRAATATLNAQGDSFSFSTAFPTACIAVMVTNRASGNNLSYFGVTSSNASGFTLRKSDTDGSLPQNFAYIAIGY